MRLRLVVVALCGVLAASGAGAADVYKFLNEIPIGGEGGWDILNIDSAARRLYLSHATKVVVVDLEKNAVVGEIARHAGRACVCCLCRNCSADFRRTARKTKSSVVDLKTLKTIAKIETGENPDAIAYDPKRRRGLRFQSSRETQPR